MAARPLVERPACLACHAEAGVQIADARCATCHGTDPRQTAPPDHDRTWLGRHGAEADWRVQAEHGAICGDCHGRDGCLACHRERRPRDHTALWQVRMHGAAAAWDRERCKTCHETGTCVRCHRNTTPVSHRGSWGTRHGQVAGDLDANCRVCHQTSWCQSCHSGGRR